MSYPGTSAGHLGPARYPRIHGRRVERSGRPRKGHFHSPEQERKTPCWANQWRAQREREGVEARLSVAAAVA